MNAADLYALGERFDKNRVLLCFNGPISRSLIEDIGNALKNYLNAEHVRSAEAMGVFSVYIEMVQNVRQYAAATGDGEVRATIVIGRGGGNRYEVSAGNLVKSGDGQALVRRIAELATMDKAALKAACETQLHRPREPGMASGAGLGLIDIARRAAASQPESQRAGRLGLL